MDQQLFHHTKPNENLNIVTPIDKSNDKDKFQNYRPILFTPGHTITSSIYCTIITSAIQVLYYKYYYYYYYKHQP